MSCYKIYKLKADGEKMVSSEFTCLACRTNKLVLLKNVIEILLFLQLFAIDSVVSDLEIRF